MGRSYTTFQFLLHLVRSRAWDSFHSPFLFALFTYCCDEKKTNPTFSLIERQRHQLVLSDKTINRFDFGAGSALSKDPSAVQMISQIASHSLSKPFQCRFLHRMAAFLKPKQILELGTSLGISTAYLATGAPQARVITVEGNPEIHKEASEAFETLHIGNIQPIHLKFEDYIKDSVQLSESTDLLFLDGHHTSDAVLSYYHALKPKMHGDTVIVVDDIYWSKDMTKGWNHLIALPEVRQSVDCFHFGLLFFKDDFIDRQNHVIRLPISMVMAKE